MMTKCSMQVHIPKSSNAESEVRTGTSAIPKPQKSFTLTEHNWKKFGSAISVKTTTRRRKPFKLFPTCFSKTVSKWQTIWNFKCCSAKLLQTFSIFKQDHHHPLTFNFQTFYNHANGR